MRADTIRVRWLCRSSTMRWRRTISRKMRRQSRKQPRPTDRTARQTPVASHSYRSGRRSNSAHLRPDRLPPDHPILDLGDRMAAARARVQFRSSPSGKRLVFRLSAVAALAGLCGCAAVSDPAGFSIVTQDRLDFMTCPEIIGARNGNNARVKQLTELIEKADASPGGFFVSATAYRTELVHARALAHAAERRARIHYRRAPETL